MSRRIAPQAIVRMRVIRILSEELGVPVPQAVALTARLEAAGSAGVEIGDLSGSLRIDFAVAERWVAQRLPDAVESAPRRRRGRPAQRRRKPADA